MAEGNGKQKTGPTRYIVLRQFVAPSIGVVEEDEQQQESEYARGFAAGVDALRRQLPVELWTVVTVDEPGWVEAPSGQDACKLASADTVGNYWAVPARGADGNKLCVWLKTEPQIIYTPLFPTAENGSAVSEAAGPEAPGPEAPAAEPPVTPPATRTRSRSRRTETVDA